jgi:nitrogen fixation protein FixH
MKNPTLKLVLAVAVVAGIGAIVGTFWVGSKVREEAVVAQPYEAGLKQAADRAARERLRWDVRVEDGPTAGGAGTLTFTVLDGQGRPLEGAAVELEVGRPDTSRGVARAAATPIGPGRFAADTGVTGRGEWLVAFDVARGGDRLRLERTVRSQEPCDLGGGPCTLPLPGGGAVSLELGPRPLRTMRELAAVAQVIEKGAPVEGATVNVSLVMPGMEMGQNVVALQAEAGRHVGRVTLVRCLSGRRDWVAEVAVGRPGGAGRDTVRFPFSVSE